MRSIPVALQQLERRLNEHFEPSVEVSTNWDHGLVIRLSWEDQLDIEENESVIRQLVKDCFHGWPDILCFPAYSPMIHHELNIFVIELNSQENLPSSLD